MKAGWYKVEPYATMHFFHDATKSVCGIEWREPARKPEKGGQYCLACQLGTGRKR